MGDHRAVSFARRSPGAAMRYWNRRERNSYAKRIRGPQAAPIKIDHMPTHKPRI